MGSRTVEEVPVVGEIYEDPTQALPDFNYDQVLNREGVPVSVPIGEDKSDVHQIVQALECMVQQFSMSPELRAYVETNVICDVGNNDLASITTQITEFVMENVTYVPDPAGTEYVVSPLVYLEQFIAGKKVQGDCDDHVVLLNSMLGTMGIQTRVLGVKLPGSTFYDHVISTVYYEGEWHDVDPCAKGIPMPQYVERLVADAPNCGGGGGVPWGAIGLGLLFLI